MKQFIKKTFTLAVFTILLILLMPANAEAKVKLNKETITLDAGKSTKLKLTGTKKKVTWSSSNKKVATVSSSGKVKAKSEGAATIKAKVGNKTYKCNITILNNWSNNYKAIAKAYKTGNSSRLSYTDKKVLAKVKKILSQNIKKDMPDEEKALVLHDWICKNATYESYTKGNVSGYINYVDVIFKGKACCAGYAGVYQLFMQCLGIENQVAHGAVGGSEHAWNVIKITGKWYNVDVTNDDQKNGSFTYGTFLVPDSLLANGGYKISYKIYTAYTTLINGKKKCTSEDYMLYPYTKDISCYQVINSIEEWKSYVIKNRDEGKKETVFLVKNLIYVQPSEFDFIVTYEEQFHKGVWSLWKVSIK